MKSKWVLTSVLSAVSLLTAACGGNTPAKESGWGSAASTLPVIQSSLVETSAEVWPSSETEADRETAPASERQTEADIAAENTTDRAEEIASEVKSESAESRETESESQTGAVTEAQTEPLTETRTETVAEPSLPSAESPIAETEPATEALTETQSEPSAVWTADGLWAPVTTMEADWATRAVSELYYTNADFGFSTYVSPYDRDGDGIEDQADILQGARDHVATRPEYDAGYFETGWPPAGKGVCTDVFNYAMLAAGYNMQELMARDVQLRRWAYDWEVGDNKIDFRRTRNLLVFCDQYLEKLTLDPYDYAAWQPGDIVIFAGRETGMWPGHIAIVSDRRASDGLPYLVHHTDNDRYSYEQDFLTTPQRIIRGHYRVGDLASHRELFD